VAKPAAPPAPLVAIPKAGGSREERFVLISPIRQRIAERLVAAQQEAALLTTFNEVDMTTVMALRGKFKDTFQERYGVKLGFMSFFVRAVVEALRAVPQVNAEFRPPHIVHRDYYDIGIAVGGGKGLVVPVLRNAETMSFAQVEQTIGDFARRAADNKLKLEELQGAAAMAVQAACTGRSAVLMAQLPSDALEEAPLLSLDCVDADDASEVTALPDAAQRDATKIPKKELESLAFKVSDRADGSYLLEWRAKKAGRYKVRVTVNHVDIPGSPLELQLIGNFPNLASARVDGNMLQGTLVCGQPAFTLLSFRDEYGNPVQPSKSGFRLGMAMLPAAEAVRERASKGLDKGRTAAAIKELYEACKKDKENAMELWRTAPPYLSEADYTDAYLTAAAADGIALADGSLSWSEVLLRLLDDPTIASKRWVYRQYDHQVQANTVVPPGGADAAVVRLRPQQGDRKSVV
jgi:hypothetical protein